MGPDGDAAERGAAAGTPRTDGYRMPAEFAPHERCLIAWPTRTRAYWGEHYMLAQHSYAAVAPGDRPLRARAGHRTAGRGAGGDAATAARRHRGRRDAARRLLDPRQRADLRAAPDGDTAVADFAFNSWGERYLPYDDDARIGERLAEHFGVKRYATPMVLEADRSRWTARGR